MSVGGEFETGTEVARIAPRNGRADRDAVDAGQFRDAPHRFLVEAQNLIGRPSVRDHRDVQREHLVRFETGLRRLQREQRLDERAGADQQHERRGDLRHGKETESAIGPAGDAHAAAGQRESVRGIG